MICGGLDCVSLLHWALLHDKQLQLARGPSEKWPVAAARMFLGSWCSLDESWGSSQERCRLRALSARKWGSAPFPCAVLPAWGRANTCLYQARCRTHLESIAGFQCCWRQKRAALIRDQSSASALKTHFFAVMQGLLSNITCSGDAISTLSNHARPFPLGASSGSLLNHREQGHCTGRVRSFSLATAAKRCPQNKYPELTRPSSPFLAPARTTRASRRSPFGHRLLRCGDGAWRTDEPCISTSSARARRRRSGSSTPPSDGIRSVGIWSWWCPRAASQTRNVEH